MIKVNDPIKQCKETIIPMREMKPLQAGYVVESGNTAIIGSLVMRTMNEGKFEVMCFEQNNYWTTGGNNIQVRLLRPDEAVTLTLSGEDY